MEELARRREEAARVELEARERDLREARRVLALPPWLRELVLQKRLLCVSLTPELERVLREERESADAPPHPYPPLPLLATAEAEEVGSEARNGEGKGAGDGLRKQVVGPDGSGTGVAARETTSQLKKGELGPEAKNASDAEDAGQEKVRTWVHRFAGTGTKSALGLNPFTCSVESLNPFKETEWGPSRRPTAESSQLLSLSTGLPAEGSWNSGVWNGSSGGGARGGALNLSTLSINVGSGFGATGGGTRPHGDLSANGPGSSWSHTGNPFDGLAPHEDTPGGGAREKRMPIESNGGEEEQKLVVRTNPGGWTSLTPAYSTLTSNGIGAATPGSQLRSVTRDGRIQIRCAPPFVLTRRIP